jgi:hypothetical protein
MAWVTKQTGLDKKTGYFYNGREIALTKYQGQTGKQKHHMSDWWPETKRIEAATVWAVLRNFDQVKELTGIHVKLLKRWSTEAWWHQIVNNVRKEQNEVLDAKITQVLDSAITMIQDRIEDGEYVLDRKASTKDNPVYYRIPLRAKDASFAVATLFDKRQLLRGEATARTESISETEKLRVLQQNFERLAQSKGINPEGELIEHDSQERERLPSEVGVGEELVETGSIEESSEEEISASRVVQET